MTLSTGPPVLMEHKWGTDLLGVDETLRPDSVDRCRPSPDFRYVYYELINRKLNYPLFSSSLRKREEPENHKKLKTG